MSPEVGVLFYASDSDAFSVTQLTSV